MIVLGIDPGTAITGYGVVDNDDRLQAIDYGVIRTSNDESLPDRLCIIKRELEQILTRHRPDAVAVEDIFFNRNVRSAFAVGHARGVVIVTAAERGIPVYSYTPLAVKSAVTGYGKADKKQVQAMVKVLTGCDDLPKTPDIADALAVAICCVHSQFGGQNLEV